MRVRRGAIHHARGLPFVAPMARPRSLSAPATLPLGLALTVSVPQCISVENYRSIISDAHQPCLIVQKSVFSPVNLTCEEYVLDIEICEAGGPIEPGVV